MGSVRAQECKETREITSNTIKALAGNGDTLWMLTRSRSGWGVNYTLNRGDSWWGYNLDCIDKKHEGFEAFSLSYGNGNAIVGLLPRDEDEKTGLLWNYAHGTQTFRKFKPEWSAEAQGDTSKFIVPVDAVFGENGYVYSAFWDGGLVVWNTSNDRDVRVFAPGQNKSVVPKAYVPDTTNRVMGVKTYTHNDKRGLLVVTPKKVWHFVPADSSWDSLSTELASDSLTFKSFEHVITEPDSVSLYAFIKWKKQNDTGVSLFKYNRIDNRWILYLREAPESVTFAPQGYIYTVDGANLVRLYQDTSGDTTGRSVAVSLVANETEMQQRLAGKNGIDMPDSVHDILFVPRTDSSGILWIGTSDGVFVSRDEIPGKTSDGFTIIKHARRLKSGLKESYALPGILAHDTKNAKGIVFVYNLSKDADVTIRVYDYNMDLVTTIIEKQPRIAGSRTTFGRSTDERVDTWDGTNRLGRPVAPGVYYYKITTSTGERTFGKIIVAR